MNRVPLNTLLQLLSRGLELASGLLVNAWVARHWGSAAFGQIGFFTSLAGVTTFLFDMGVGTLLIRSVAREPARVRPYLAAGARLILPLSLLGTAIVVAIGRMNVGSQQLPILLLVGAQLTFGALAQLLRAAFYAFERMEYESIAIACERTLWIGAGLWLALRPPDLLALFAWMAFGKLASVLVGAWLFERRIAPGLSSPDARPVAPWPLLRESWPFGLNIAFGTIAGCVDLLLLSFVAPEHEVGLYRAAGLVIMPMTLSAVALNNALFPRMCAAFRGAGSRPLALALAGRRAARFALAVAVPACIFTAAFAPQLITLMFGRRFVEAAPLLAVLAAVVPLRFMHHTLGTALTAADRQGRRMACAGLGAGVNVVLNLLLLPLGGAMAACGVAIASDLVQALLLRQELGRALGTGFGIFGLAAAAGLGAVILVAPLAWIGAPWWLAAGVLALAYPLMLVSTGIYRMRELAELAGAAPVTVEAT